MSDSGRLRITPRLVLGLGVVAIGLLFTADSLGLTEADLVYDWWPVLLIAIGLTQIGSRTTYEDGGVTVVVVPGNRVFAAFWIGAGLWLLAWNLDVVEINPFEFFWPFVLIALGLSLAFGARRRARSSGDESMVNIISVMGGVDRKVGTSSFEGGDITAFMGGGRLDLRQAQLAGGEAELRIFAMWGGYEIRVPSDWEVANQLLPILGAAEDKRTFQERREGAPKLVLNGVVIMGGIEVKS